MMAAAVTHGGQRFKQYQTAPWQSWTNASGNCTNTAVRGRGEKDPLLTASSWMNYASNPL